MASQSNGLCIHLEEYHTNKYPMATPEQMYGKEHIQRLHRKWNPHKDGTEWQHVSSCIKQYKCTFSVRCQICPSCVYRVKESHTVSVLFLQRFDFGSVNFLHAIPVSCSVMPCSVIFCYVLSAGPTPASGKSLPGSTRERI